MLCTLSSVLTLLWSTPNHVLVDLSKDTHQSPKWMASNWRWVVVGRMLWYLSRYMSILVLLQYKAIHKTVQMVPYNIVSSHQNIFTYQVLVYIFHFHNFHSSILTWFSLLPPFILALLPFLLCCSLSRFFRSLNAPYKGTCNRIFPYIKLCCAGVSKF